MTDSSGGRGGPLSVLTAGAAALARSDSLDAGLASLLDALTGATGASFAAVFAQDPDRAELDLLATHGMTPDDASAYGAGVAEDAEHPVRRVATEGAETIGRIVTAADGSSTSAAELPLVVAHGGIDEQIGVLSVGWAGAHEVGPDESQLLHAGADLVAVALDRARLASVAAERAEWFERMAHTDPLTGLSNARTVHRVLELEVVRASRQGSEVSVAVFDVDGFAAANAAIGTRGGDRILREVAAVLAESVRLVDTIARTGGDEFVLVAPGSAGVTVARRVMEGIATLEAVDGHRIAVSAGVARFPGDGTDVEALLASAREALEEARRTAEPIAEAHSSTSA